MSYHPRHIYLNAEWLAVLERVSAKLAVDRKRPVSASEAVRVALGRMARHYGIRPPEEADARKRVQK